MADPGCRSWRCQLRPGNPDGGDGDQSALADHALDGDFLRDTRHPAWRRQYLFRDHTADHDRDVEYSGPDCCAGNADHDTVLP